MIIQKTKIAFLVLPYVHLMDMAGPEQVFLEAIDYCASFELDHCTVEDSVKSSSLLPFGKMQHYSKIKLKAGDFLIIAGARLSYLQSQKFKSEKKLFAWIRSCYDNNIKICSICSGAFVLAESGILNGKECTTHWKRTAELQALYPEVHVVENVLFTEEQGIYTSAGIASGIDLALHIIEQQKGSWLAHKVAREMVVYCRRSGSQKQQSALQNFRNHIHIGVHNVQDWLHENLHKKASLNALATVANMSSRNFTRVFRKETSLTVNEYITLVRKEKIEQLLANPNITRNEIAKQCGLKSERQINRILNGK